MGKVIVFGSLNMDITIQCERMPEAGETISGENFFINAGGKGGNQAVAASKLGADTRMIGCVGRDVFGKDLCETLRKYQVTCDTVFESNDLPSGTAMITRCNGDNRIIVNSGANHEQKAEEVKRLVCQYGTKDDVFLTQYECDIEAVQQSLVAAKKAGMYTVFNPAPANKIPKNIYPFIDLIVVNEMECQYLTGILPENDEKCIKAVKQFKDMGAGQVVITLGSKGCIYTFNDEIGSIPAYKMTAVDTTAAGDTFIGGLAVGISRKWPMKECVIYATKAAALTVIKYGAQKSIPYEKEVNEYFKEAEK